MATSMSDSSRVVKLKKFPLEAEAIATMAQHELAALDHASLLKYAQQTVLVMSQLRHYCAELIMVIESFGYEIDGSTEERG